MELESQSPNPSNEKIQNTDEEDPNQPPKPFIVLASAVAVISVIAHGVGCIIIFASEPAESIFTDWSIYMIALSMILVSIAAWLTLFRSHLLAQTVICSGISIIINVALFLIRYFSEKKFGDSYELNGAIIIAFLMLSEILGVLSCLVLFLIVGAKATKRIRSLTAASQFSYKTQSE